MHMRWRAALAVAVVACTVGTNNPAEAAESPELSALKGGGPVSLGLVGGTTNGLSLKIWPARAHGIVLHVGAPPPVLNSLSVHLSYRLHFPPIIAPDGGPVLHFQIGPAFRSRTVFGATTFAELGGGIVVGTSVTVPQWPVEFFAEVQPTFAGSVSVPGTGLGLGIEGVGGVRISFGKSKASEPQAAESSWGQPTETVLAPEPEPEGETDPDSDGETPSPDAEPAPE